MRSPRSHRAHSCTSDTDVVALGSERFDSNMPTYADCRSEERALNRMRKQKQKYYAYRGVKPSWVGQQYYSLALVSEETVTIAKSRKQNNYMTTEIIECDESDKLDNLLDQAYWGMTAWYTPQIITQAVAESKALLCQPSPDKTGPRAGAAPPFRIPVPNTLDAPQTLTLLLNTLHRDPTILSPANHQLKLGVRTWTKQDNFSQKESFSGGPDRRHHHGRRRVRERYHAKWHAREHEQNMKAKETLMTLNDANTSEGRELVEARYAMVDTVYWDFVHLEPSPSLLFDDSGKAYREIGGEKIEQDVEAERRAAQEAYRYMHMYDDEEEEEYCPSDIDEDGNFWVEFAQSLASSDIVAVSAEDADDRSTLGGEFDDLADLAEALFDEVEWDVLSESSVLSVSSPASVR